ncbi:TPR_REGION domain-containing protein [Meloidogyne graminicola]|uniref:TPR_REGION domain-containing protein n=1 Tax=Meloidogyne graminicola TaxID=189291 RepID=A0A8T0A278_9BILA|nr:TPR_REGION domain-containing protein [Meloidogyne graminicola]
MDKAHIDQLNNENKHQQIYEHLAKIGDNLHSDPEILWRFARACYFIANPLDHKDPKKKNLLDEGYFYAEKAYQLCDGDFEIIKCFAAVTGARTDFLGTKEKIEQGNLFKELLDKALAMNSGEVQLLHMRGRFAFSVASLTWLERKAAAAFYSKPPEATFDEAIEDFLAVFELEPDWLDNLFYLGKTYLLKKEKETALKYLRRAVDSYQQNENEQEPIMISII